jgi:hypothetical protein
MCDLFGLNTFSVYLSLVFRRFNDPTERLLEYFCPLVVFRAKKIEIHGTDFRYFSHLSGDLLQTGLTVTLDMYTFLPTCRLEVTKY